jgi:hypothetical protein
MYTPKMFIKVKGVVFFLENIRKIRQKKKKEREFFADNFAHAFICNSRASALSSPRH